jgi:FKBP-type peptidyl-prolyl cis-trans isomerase FkpA
MRKTMRTSRSALALALALGACGGKSNGGDPTDVEYAASLGIDLSRMTKTASGLYYQDITVGTGAEVAQGDRVTVGYAVWLTDGTLIDSGSLPFTVGDTDYIDGFNEGVTGMKVGGQRKLVVPPELGYGAQGSGRIPGNAVLVFELNLLDLTTP